MPQTGCGQLNATICMTSHEQLYKVGALCRLSGCKFRSVSMYTLCLYLLQSQTFVYTQPPGPASVDMHKHTNGSPHVQSVWMYALTRTPSPLANQYCARRSEGAFFDRRCCLCYCMSRTSFRCVVRAYIQGLAHLLAIVFVGGKRRCCACRGSSLSLRVPACLCRKGTRARYYFLPQPLRNCLVNRSTHAIEWYCIFFSNCDGARVSPRLACPQLALCARLVPALGFDIRRCFLPWIFR